MSLGANIFQRPFEGLCVSVEGGGGGGGGRGEGGGQFFFFKTHYGN